MQDLLIKISKNLIKFFSNYLSVTCGGYFNKSTSSFTSPYYPNNYINNLNCTWVINVDVNSKIMLIFNEIITESTHDFIEVFDGNSVRDQSFGKFSGLTVFFKTDKSNVYKGFSAKYGIKLKF
jgi:hypothetical protein